MAGNAVGFGWRLRNSWWVLLVVLGLGCLSGTGFLYIGITARRPAWWGLGIAYLVLPWAGLVAINRLGDAPASTAIAVAYFVLWFAGIVHALLLNGSWLRWRAANRPWFEQQPPAAAALAPPPTFPAPPPPSVAPAAFGAYPPGVPGAYAPAASGADVPAVPGAYVPAAPGADMPEVPGAFASAAPRAWGTDKSGAPRHDLSDISGMPESRPAAPFGAIPAPPGPNAAAPGIAGMLDVNAATAAQLVQLARLDSPRAERLVADREAWGGFQTVEEFAAAAALAPHEYARLRPVLTCTPRPRAPQHNPGGGRVLDF
ncbi:ComEA family DNA-binding protein [Dactylosporangium sp. CA-233914]|uniref:ComEA family DNA-binding protein n=1 Tax=Dactylosporangium sp. CA-233914 TaxID=3239934 RepID=UPI003D8F902C